MIVGTESAGATAGKEATAATVGGKAANLLILSRIPGIQVPPFRVVDTSWFEACLPRPATASPLRPAELRDKILASDPGPAFRAFLEAQIAALQPAGFRFLSVRSSAVGEDSAENSFAGQFDTVLNVPLADA